MRVGPEVTVEKALPLPDKPSIAVLPFSNIRHPRGDTLWDVGKFFGIAKNSPVSSVDRRLKREMIKDKKIEKNVETLKFELGKGQE
jgi:hypothetical protein